MRKFLKALHLWLSVPAGIVITLMCLTGAVLVFQEEALRIFHPERYQAEQNAAGSLPLDEIIERANARLTGDAVTAVQIPNDPERTYIATLVSGQRSHAYIDPYTGEITGYYNYREGFFSDVMRLHRWLMFKDTKAGRLITGVSTLFFIFILVSGFVLWWPRRNAFKRSFFRVKWKSSSRRRLFDLHRVWGMYATAVLLLLCLTGLMWSFDWYRQSVASVFHVEQTAGGQQHGGGGQGGDGNQGQGPGQGQMRGQGGQSKGRQDVSEPDSDWWQRALAVSEKELSGGYQFVRIASDGTVAVLPAKAAHPRAMDTYRFHSHENSLEPLSKYGENRNGSYMMTWAYALHTGSWGGIWSKILVFIASLIGASLPVTGYMLWFKKLRSNHSGQNGPIR